MRYTRLIAAALCAALLAGCSPGSLAASTPSQSPEPVDPTPPSASQSAAPSPTTPEGPNVRVDWSRLEDNRTPLLPDTDSGRWYEDYTDHLIPSEEYGPLVPYVGGNVYSFSRWMDDQGQEQIGILPWPTPMYGLMTLQGKIVTDPVYLGAHHVEFYQEEETTVLPVLILSQAREEWNDSNSGRRYALAAKNGAWSTDFEFWGYTAREDEVLLYGPAGLTWIDPVSGARADWNWDALGVPEGDLPRITEEIQWVFGFQWTHAGVFLGMIYENEQSAGQVRLFDPETLEVSLVSQDEWDTILTEWWDLRSDGIGWEIRHNGQEVTVLQDGLTYSFTLPRPWEDFSWDHSGDFCVITDYNYQHQAWLYRLSDGALLLEGVRINLLSDRARPQDSPCIVVQREDGLHFYSPDSTALFSLPLERPSGCYCTLQDGILTVRDDQTFFGCYNAQTGRCIFYRNLDLGD